MNPYERMREWITTQDGPRGTMQFSVALGINGASAANAIANMWRSGALIRHPTTPYTYTIGAAPQRKRRLTAEERREAVRLRDIRQRRKRGCVPRAEYEAACKAKRDAERAAIDARKAARKAAAIANRPAVMERERARLKARVYVSKSRKPKAAKPAKFKPIAVPRMRLVASQPAPVVVPLMSSAEWLAANPTHRIEVIAPGVFSERNQFKHIGVAA